MEQQLHNIAFEEERDRENQMSNQSHEQSTYTSRIQQQLRNFNFVCNTIGNQINNQFQARGTVLVSSSIFTNTPYKKWLLIYALYIPALIFYGIALTCSVLYINTDDDDRANDLLVGSLLSYSLGSGCTACVGCTAYSLHNSY